MRTVALAGGIGCGKSAATAIFAELGVPIVDLDVISHRLTNEDQTILQHIASQFGDDVINTDGTLNRAAMRKIVFNDVQARAKLNAILHPAIQREALVELQRHQQQPYAILAIPLLDQHSPYLSAINYILLIDCDESTQIARVKARSQLSDEEIQHIMQAQCNRAERLALADEVINNEGSLAELREKIMVFHQKYINACILSKTSS